MDKWKRLMLDGKKLSERAAIALLKEHGEKAGSRAAARMREARKRRMSERALHWSRVAMWIKELRKSARKDEEYVSLPQRCHSGDRAPERS